ncbi:DNA gyrase subunit B [Mycobacteroides abscessus subsp. massiliense]|nr:DNA gyrase subunit B [Mycobacteroides abscessus subsp. massiliense]SLI16803.1 DNA gyrase subunit B [Mycobacteroides abscessus subsp. massiliense]
MNTSVRGAELTPPSGRQVRDRLIEYAAEALRQLQTRDRTFIFLPRVLVPTEWAGWMHEAEASQSGDRRLFSVIYVFSPAGDWDPQAVKDDFQSLWQGKLGWECTNETLIPADGAALSTKSPDGYELILEARPRKRISSLHLISPDFSASANTCPATMPFAITPVGELSLGATWATHPEIFTD